MFLNKWSKAAFMLDTRERQVVKQVTVTKPEEELEHKPVNDFYGTTTQMETELRVQWF
jgi:hypothetical protein